MSTNWISCRRVKFQEIDKRGRPLGKPTYGVLVSDDFAQAYDDTYKRLTELNIAIAQHGLVGLVGGEQFDVDSDDPRWKDNYAGIKHAQDAGESP